MSDIPLREQIAAVERALAALKEMQGQYLPNAGMKREADRLAAALATLRGLLLIEETR